MDKAILVYTVSDKDLRNELVEMLRHRGWEEHQDQSTLTLPQDSPSVFNRSEFAEWMENWGRNRNWINDDFVSVFYLDRNNEESGLYTIKNNHYPTRKK